MLEPSKIRRTDVATRILSASRSEFVRGANSKDKSATAAIREYARIIANRRWSFAAGALAIFAATLIFVFCQKPIYEATALVEIEPPSPEIVSVGRLFEEGSVTDNYLQTQFEILQSGSLAQGVIHDLHLDHLAEFHPAAAHAPAERSEHPGTDLGDFAAQIVQREFERRMLVLPIPRTRLARIKFDDHDPLLAADIVNSITAHYIAANLHTRWDAAQKASEWLGAQIESAQAKLQNSQMRLQRYARANGLLYFENDQGGEENIVDAKLRQLQSDLTQAQANRYQKESLYSLVRAGNDRSVAELSNDSVAQYLMKQLAELRREQAQLAASFKSGYPKMQAISNQIAQVQQQLSDRSAAEAKRIEGEFVAAERNELLLAKAFHDQQQRTNIAAEKSAEYKILKHDVDSSQSLYDGLLQRQKDAGISADMKAANIRVIDPAIPPAFPIQPRVLLDLSAGFLLAIVGGFALALVRERNENAIRSASDAATLLGIPVLALLPPVGLTPAVNGGRRAHTGAGERLRAAAQRVHSGKASPVERQEPALAENAEFSAAVRRLRSSILLSSALRPPRSLAILSASKREGKTATCCSLATAFAESGKRVLVVDANLRAPAVHEFFGVPQTRGLAEYLSGGPHWREAVQQTRVTGLYCLICESGAPDPAELLLSSRMQQLLREAEGEYEFVLVDTSPLLCGDEAGILASRVERGILVVNCARASREAAHRAQSRAVATGAQLLGIVFANFDSDSRGQSSQHDAQTLDTSLRASQVGGVATL